MDELTTSRPSTTTEKEEPSEDLDPKERHYELDLKSASLEEEEQGWSPYEARKKRQVLTQLKPKKKKNCRPKKPIVLDPRCIYDETTPVALGFCRVDFLLCMPKGDGYRVGFGATKSNVGLLSQKSTLRSNSWQVRPSWAMWRSGSKRP